MNWAASRPPWLRGAVLLRSRSLYGFALGNVLDKQGAYDEAFGYYRQANDLKRRLLQDKGEAFSARSHQAFVDKIIATYDVPYFERVKTWGMDSETPVFIVGMPGSGSTLVEQILASHPQVFGAGDIGDLFRFGPPAPAANAADKTPPSAVEPLPNKDAMQQLAAAYLQHLGNLGQGAASHQQAPGQFPAPGRDRDLVPAGTHHPLPARHARSVPILLFPEPPGRGVFLRFGGHRRLSPIL